MKLRPQLLVAYFVVLLLMIAVAVATYRSVQAARETVTWVEHTHEVIEHANLLGRLIVDMETGERGFLITGNEEFLDPYRSGQESYAKEITDLKDLVSDNPPQVALCERIDALVTDWQDLAATPAIAMRRKVDLPSPEASMADVAALVESATGKDIVDDIRDQLASFVGAEQALLAERHGKEQDAVRQSLGIVALGIVLALVIAAVGIAQDAAARTRAERQAEAAREYAESIVSTVREPLVVLDESAKVISANRSYYETFRAGPNETEGRLLYDLGDRQWDIPALRELLEQVLPQNTSFDDFEVERDFPRVGERSMLLNARPVYGEAAERHMVLLTIEDITTRKQTEAQVRRLATVFMDAADPILIEDLDGNVVDMNEEAERAYGWSRDELVGRSIKTIIPPEKPEQADELRAQLRAGGAVRNAEVVRWRKDGTRIPELLTLSLLTDDEGEAVGIATLCKDITARKQAEGELEAANQELDAFAYSVSHDLRAPMRHMDGFSKMLLEDCGDRLNEDGRFALEAICDASAHMNRLVDGLLRLSRSTRSGMDWEGGGLEPALPRHRGGAQRSGAGPTR